MAAALLVRGDGGHLLRGPNGFLARGLECCCETCCCVGNVPPLTLHARFLMEGCEIPETGFDLEWVGPTIDGEPDVESPIGSWIGTIIFSLQCGVYHVSVQVYCQAESCDFLCNVIINFGPGIVVENLPDGAAREVTCASFYALFEMQPSFLWAVECDCSDPVIVEVYA